MNRSEINRCSGVVVSAAMNVHSAMGPCLLESAYEACLAHELRKRGLRVESQVPVTVVYDNTPMEIGYRIDLLVDHMIVVELKAVTSLIPIHAAQMFSYLRLSGHPVGLLINFHEVRLRDGIKRFVNGY